MYCNKNIIALKYIGNNKQRNRAIQLNFARTYRKVSISKLSSKSGVSAYRLSRFEKQLPVHISDDELRNIMKSLNFPFNFIDKKMGVSGVSFF